MKNNTQDIKNIFIMIKIKESCKKTVISRLGDLRVGYCKTLLGFTSMHVGLIR